MEVINLSQPETGYSGGDDGIKSIKTGMTGIQLVSIAQTVPNTMAYLCTALVKKHKALNFSFVIQGNRNRVELLGEQFGKIHELEF